MTRKADQRVARARSFRQNPTEAERKLWQRLRKLSLGSAHFRRQATIGPYFADFACHTNRQVIEVDGGQHADSFSDQNRADYLNASGYRVMRLWNSDVLDNIEGVLQTIINAIEAPPTPDPSPPQERVEGRVS